MCSSQRVLPRLFLVQEEKKQEFGGGGGRRQRQGRRRRRDIFFYLSWRNACKMHFLSLPHPYPASHMQTLANFKKAPPLTYSQPRVAWHKA